MAGFMLEKDGPMGFLYSNFVSTTLADTYRAFSDRREALGLPNPGTLDNISKETQHVFLTGMTFAGLKADFTKALSFSPLFQVSHAFAVGSQVLPPYNFSALYGTDRVFMQGSVDNDKSIRANFNWRWASNLVTKTSLQLGSGPGQEVLSIDNEYTGRDFTASLKAINPSPLDNALVGMYMAGYLQSITPSLALGFEALWQRQALTMGPETAFSYCAKYTGLDWIASARLASQGMVTASYWRKLTEKVEVGADVQLQFAGLSGAAAMMGGPKNDGIATMGARYDFRMSSFKAQLDSTGKLSCLLEKRIAPPVSVTFAADMDHSKQSAKLGFGVQIDGTSEELQEMQQNAPDSAPPQIPV